MGKLFFRVYLLCVCLAVVSPATGKDQNSNGNNHSSSSSNGKKSLQHPYLSWLWNWRKPANTSPTAQMCSVPFSNKVQVTEIKGNHLYIPLSELPFLASPNGFQLQDVELNLTLKGKHQSTQNLTVSFNGLKVSKIGQQNYFSFIDYLKSKDQSRLSTKLHPLVINGSESFDRFLLRLKKNKGLLKLSIHGKSNHVIAAEVTFKGITYNPCGTPGPTTTTTTSTTSTTLKNPGGSTPTTTTSTTTTTTITTTTTLPPEDLSKYKVSIDSKTPSTSPTSSATMLIYFSSVNTDGSFWCALDQAAFEKCESPMTYANLESGVHKFEVYATTPRGATVSPATAYQWTVDRIAPVVTITNTESLPVLTNQTSLTFQFTSTKAGTFYCQMNQSPATVCQSPYTVSVLTEGLQTFSVTSVDALGNASGTSAKYQWTLDLTPPSTSILAVSPTEALSSSSSKAITFAASETSNFECSVDQGDYTTCDSPLKLTDLSEGTHFVEIRAKDLAGNIGSTISSSWTTDYTAPKISLGSLTPATGLTNAASVSVEFSSDEPGLTYCQWDNLESVICESPFKASFVNDGAHQLTITAVDRVGLQSSPVTVQWMSDSTAPVISFAEILPSTESVLNTTEMSFSINASEEMRMTASLNGSVIEPFTNPIQLKGLGEGTFVLIIAGYDSAGNFSNQISHQFVIDQTAPTVALTANGPSLTNLDSRSFEIAASESVEFKCSLDQAGYEACQSPAHFSGLADGEHLLIVKATDAAGNSATTSASWTVDTTAPQTLEAHNQIGNAITFSLASSESNSTFLCSMDGAPASTCTSPVSYTGLSIGSHSFVAQAVDAAGNIDPVGARYTVQVLGPIKTFITNSNPSANLINSTAMTIWFTADQATSGYVCSLDGSSFASCVSPATYSGLGNGNHTFVVKAISTAGVMDQTGASKTWSVDTIAPTITSFSSSTKTNSITVTWFTNEPSTAKVTYGVGTNMNQATAEDMTLTTSHTVTLTGLSSNTMYSIQVSGRDAAGNPYTSTIQTVRTNR